MKVLEPCSQSPDPGCLEQAESLSQRPRVLLCSGVCRGPFLGSRGESPEFMQGKNGQQPPHVACAPSVVPVACVKH